MQNVLLILLTLLQVIGRLGRRFIGLEPRPLPAFVRAGRSDFSYSRNVDDTRLPHLPTAKR